MSNNIESANKEYLRTHETRQTVTTASASDAKSTAAERAGHDTDSLEAHNRARRWSEETSGAGVQGLGQGHQVQRLNFDMEAMKASDLQDPRRKA